MNERLILPLKACPPFPGSVHTLHVRSEPVVYAIAVAAADSREIALVAQRSLSGEPNAGAFFDVGCLCQFHLVTPTHAGVAITPDTVARIRVRNVRCERELFWATCEPFPDAVEPWTGDRFELLQRVAERAAHSLEGETIRTYGMGMEDVTLSYALASCLKLSPADAQAVLAAPTTARRMDLLWELAHNT